jgi:hypothetical protein
MKKIISLSILFILMFSTIAFASGGFIASVNWSDMLQDGVQYLFVHYGDAIISGIFAIILGFITNFILTSGNRYLKFAGEQVKEVVVVAQETTVAEYKKANEDGKITKEEGESIRAAVIARVKDKLGLIGKLIIKTFAGDVQKWIEEKVEYYLAEIKGRL